MSQYLDAIVNATLTIVGALVLYFIKSWFDEVKKSIVALQNEIEKRDKRFFEFADKVANRYRGIENGINLLGASVKQIEKDVAKLEGAQDISQKQLIDMVTKVERASARIDAAFRFIDNAHKRATDTGPTYVRE